MNDFIVLARSVVIAGLLAATPVWADNITGGSVTSGLSGAAFQDLSSSLPAAVGDNNLGGSPNLFAFEELQNFTLTSALATQVGLNPIPAGTTINSDFVTLEPGSTTETLVGTVDFSSRILAVITSDGGLIASNFLGAPGVIYNDPSDVGLEAGDTATIDGANPDQLDWDTSASIPGDSARVITLAVAPVPEPSSLLLFGTFLAGTAITVKRRRLRAS
jgi:PEP-CTERM motif